MFCEIAQSLHSINFLAAGTGRWDTKKVCNICGKVLSRGDKLKNHIRTHTNNFPFHCDTCGQGFLRSEGLRVHTRIHTGERPYVCIVCSKGYTRKDKLTRHAVVHTGERPFVCQHCGKSFTRKDKLQRHEMIHRVDKPFTCVPCNLEFVRQETFNAHMERKHPERLPYTVFQQPRSGSPSYNPQGLNLSGLSDTKSNNGSNTKVSVASNNKVGTTLASTSSGSSLLSGTSVSGSGNGLAAGHSILGGTSLLSGTSLFSGTTLSTGVSQPGEWRLENSEQQAVMVTGIPLNAIPLVDAIDENRKFFLSILDKVRECAVFGEFSKVQQAAASLGAPSHSEMSSTLTCICLWLGRVTVGQTSAHRPVRSSAMATVDISCKCCEFDYWEIIAPAVLVEDSEFNDNREGDVPQPRPSTFR
ncbi:Zinc finger protein 383 [Portunus trituberculatus]|uniref:Zinc finger protein 383 n=1 Tax=Portunus trituberculatus TaxID=210409 RepID=A0A5B7CS77_PORTR|nr:Zinc finger protein 383 [Portunus trituberculatus]